MKGFLEILNIAKRKVHESPSFRALPSEEAIQSCLRGIEDEVKEVEEEIRRDNKVYLEDELGDILWDYARLLAVLERDGFITSTGEVFAHGSQKFKERLPGILSKDEELWDQIKRKQKEDLKSRHEKEYGE
jgi:NTP pyrophosphatase (non-canonical NTP hydrolase)